MKKQENKAVETKVEETKVDETEGENTQEPEKVEGEVVDEKKETGKEKLAKGIETVKKVAKPVGRVLKIGGLIAAGFVLAKLTGGKDDDYHYYTGTGTSGSDDHESNEVYGLESKSESDSEE